MSQAAQNTRKSNDKQRFMYTYFGALKNLYIPCSSIILRNASENERSSYVGIMRVDELPEKVRAHLGSEYLTKADNSLEYSAEDLRSHKSPGGESVLSDRLLKGQDVFEPSVDPLLTKHFFVAYEEGPMILSGDAQVRLELQSAEALAAVRLTVGFPIAVSVPVMIMDSSHAGALISFRHAPELRCPFDQYELQVADTSDISEIRGIFDTISTDAQHVRAVLRRLNIGANRTLPEERLVDYVTGLEALYCADSKYELTYRLGVRCACHIGNTADDRHRIFVDIKDLYNIRSRLVHGTSENLAAAVKRTRFKNNYWQAVNTAEELLYEGLRKVLSDNIACNKAEERSQNFDQIVLQPKQSVR